MGASACATKTSSASSRWWRLALPSTSISPDARLASAVVSERREHPTGEELALPDDLPVRKRRTARMVWFAVGAVAAVGAFQFLQAADDATDRPIGTYIARSIVPLAEPSVSAFGSSGEVKLAFALPAQEISYPLDVHGDPTALQYAWIPVRE